MKTLILALSLVSTLSQAIPDDSAAIEFYSDSEWRCKNNVWQVKVQDLWLPWYNDQGEPTSCEELAYEQPDE